VAGRLRAAGHRVELLHVVTTGDRWSAAGGADASKGLFVKELEEALLDGRADLAVHSAKDLPGELPPGLAILAVPEREDPRDVLIGPDDGLPGLAPGARVGTGSPRRAAQIRLARPDITCVEIRGNVGTRLDKLARGEGVDALMLASAGLARLGLAPHGLTPLDVSVCVPAPGQGALAIEGRADRPDLAEGVALLDDPATAVCLRAERALLAALGGGCREPIGALGIVDRGVLHLTAFAASEGGDVHARGDVVGAAADAQRLGDRLAATLKAQITSP
jgi:hydroxymethylbilane synthase